MSKNVSGVVTWLKGWFYDKNEIDNLGIEYIVGTHGTTATPTWTGTSTKLTSLQTGQVIYFKMTSAGTSAGDTLNLTLANGTTTGAKNIYYNGTATKLTTHFPQNSVLCLVYDDRDCWIATQIQNTNSYDRLINTGQIVAGENLSSGRLVYCDSDDGKYYQLKRGAKINVNHLIFYTNAALDQDATGNAVFSAYSNINLANTISNFSFGSGNSNLNKRV